MSVELLMKEQENVAARVRAVSVENESLKSTVASKDSQLQEVRAKLTGANNAVKALRIYAQMGLQFDEIRSKLEQAEPERLASNLPAFTAAHEALTALVDALPRPLPKR